MAPRRRPRPSRWNAREAKIRRRAEGPTSARDRRPRARAGTRAHRAGTRSSDVMIHFESRRILYCTRAREVAWMRGSAASLARTVPSLLQSRRDPRETAGAPRLSRRALVHLAGLFGRGRSGDGRVGLVRRGGFGVRGRLRWDQDGSGAGGRRSLGRGLASWALLGVGNEGSGQRRLVRSRLVGT